MKTQILFTILLFLFTPTISKTQNYLNRGSSISVEDDAPFIVSQDRTFSCGFYKFGTNAYMFAIWYTDSKDKTVVWTANRDKPVNGKISKISIRKDGAMILTDVDGSIVFGTNTSSTDVKKAELLNSGNLVLKDTQDNFLWQSFDFPTDTLLPFQTFTKSKKLISSIQKGGYTTGYFSFYFDNVNVLRLFYDEPEITSMYWPNLSLDIYQNGRTIYNSSRIAKLDDKGFFLSSDRFFFSATDRGSMVKRRLTIDYDGNLRLYSLNNSTKLWDVTWQAMAQMCNVHGLCGRNGICGYYPEPMCSCPTGYEVADPTDWNQGCKPMFDDFCSNSEKTKFVEIKSMDYYGFDLLYIKMATFDNRRNSCLTDCRCLGFSYRLAGDNPCYTKSALFNGVKVPSFPGTFYLKLPVTVGSRKMPVGSTVVLEGDSNTMKWVYLYSFAGAIGFIEIIVVLLGWVFFRGTLLPETLENGYRVISSQKVL